MIQDINMQHMTMTEYVAIAILTEIVSNPAIDKVITENKVLPSTVVETCFQWGDVFMQVRLARQKKRAGNEGATVGLGGASTIGAQAEPTTSSEAKGGEDATTLHS